MRRIVLDASVVLAWFIDDKPEAVEAAGRIREHLFRHSVICMVPGLWHIEVGARLLRARRDPHKNFSEDHLAAALDVLDSLFVQTHHPGLEPRQVVQLGRAYNLTGYDAVYFHLAAAEGIPLATLDSGLRNACAAHGVELFQP